MAKRTYTPSMLASALKHYEERATWVRLHVRVAGRPTRYVITFASSKKDAEGRPLVYQTMETWCSCPGFEYHGGVCSHWLSVQMEIAQERRKMARKASEPKNQHSLTDAF
jgi:hypothetical protein